MVHNPLQFPASTIVDQKVPKNAFYKRAKPRRSTALQAFLTEVFESVIWLYKLHPSTLNIADGRQVHEIDLFECRLREPGYDVELLCEMDALIPRQTVFLLSYGGRSDILLQYKSCDGGTVRATGQVERLTDADLSARPLRIDGYDMDAVYASLLGQVSQYGSRSEADYLELCELTRQYEAAQRQCDALERQKEQEPQYNLRLEIRRALMRQRDELAELAQEIERIKHRTE